MCTDRTGATSESEREVGGRHSVRAGLEGGLFATLVMTVFRAPTARALPPTTEFLAQYRGGDPEDYPVASLGFHLLYGVAAGLGFGPAFVALAGETDEPESVGLVLGGSYGLVLSVVGEHLVLGRLLGVDLDTDEAAVFHAGHLVYGLTLGVWVGSRS